MKVLVRQRRARACAGLEDRPEPEKEMLITPFQSPSGECRVKAIRREDQTMLSRRSFLKSTLGAGLALATQGCQQMAAQPARKRIIVDAQVHLWKAESPDWKWVPGARPQLPEPFTTERLVPMMDEAGVDRVVIVPPSWPGDRNDYALEAAKQYPGRFAIMGRIALNDSTTARRFATWKEQPGVLGIRLNIAVEQAAWLTDGTADWFWPAAEKAGIPVMFLTTGQTPLFARIAERYPQLILIIDHMGVSSEAVKNKTLPVAIDHSAALAKYPNVSIKMSAAPWFSSEAYPFRDVTVHLRRVFAAYGPQRCYWGTDMTNSFAKATYRQRITHFTEELNFLTESDKDCVMGRAILERLK
jgi:predicted TIM-barrel fold metal-dependent hydrolase